MIACKIYSCKSRPGRPCCTYCDDRTCLNRCENHPDRCRVWEEVPESGLREPKGKIDAAEVVRLFQSGLTVAEIAAELGYTKSHISLTLRRSGIRQRRERPWLDHAEIRRLHEAGMSGREIAKRMGCSSSTVSLVLHEKAGDGHG